MPKGVYKRKPLTEEHKQKLSLAGKGKKHTKEHKRNISLAKTGKKRTEETRKKISEASKGKPKSLEHRRKLSLANKGKPHFNQRGEKNNNWKDGITPLNQKIRHSLEYKLWRTSVYKRDNYKCQMIGGCPDKTNHQLEANHIKLFSKYPELRLEVSNGITLCKPCHKYIRGREQRYENYFKLIIDN